MSIPTQFQAVEQAVYSVAIDRNISTYKLPHLVVSSDTLDLLN
ncbi:hypothetical protein [Chamaesiphon sp. GL140_3_metabinner_50]|nr:hypothetical protein [Chamaesiphon sp. GL140_3_metabinner_50]